MKKLTLLLIVLFSMPAAAKEYTARELTRIVDRIMRAQTTAAIMMMEIKTKNYEREYKMVAWDDARDSDEKFLVKILGPASYRGFGTLKIGTQLWMYNPSHERVTRLETSMLSDNWMGSHFTNDDLVKETEFDKHYGQEIIKKSKAEGGRVDYVLLLKPKPQAPVVWDKIQLYLYLEKEIVLPTKMEFFKRIGDKLPHRTMYYTNFKKIQDRMIPLMFEMRVANKPEEYTRIIYKDIRFNVDIPREKFTIISLKK